MNILLIDNYDSFTYNLLHLFAQIPGVHVEVVLNDAVSLEDLKTKKYDGIIIGPGPGSPDDEKYFGINMKIIKDFGGQRLPILGICLGFQGIALAFGADLKRPSYHSTEKLLVYKLLKPTG